MIDPFVGPWQRTDVLLVSRSVTLAATRGGGQLRNSPPHKPYIAVKPAHCPVQHFPIATNLALDHHPCPSPPPTTSGRRHRRPATASPDAPLARPSGPCAAAESPRGRAPAARRPPPCRRSPRAPRGIRCGATRFRSSSGTRAA